MNIIQFLRSSMHYSNPNSPAAKMRAKRFKIFLEFLKGDDQRPLKILDVGGKEIFWKIANFVNTHHTITLINLRKRETHYDNVFSFAGDARNMPQFKDGEFDVVFSNSVIEHVGGHDDQVKMASELRRIGKKYFVQTPNYYFPIEPHFLFPCFQFLPVAFRIFLLRNFTLVWYRKTPDYERARKIVLAINLLKYKEFKSLFPEAEIRREKFFGLTKSFMAIKR